MTFADCTLRLWTFYLNITFPFPLLIANCKQANLSAIQANLTDIKQLLDEVFVISRIIKVKVGIISRSQRLRLITLTETLIILDITKLESNIVLLDIERNKKKNSCLCFFADGKQNKASELDLDMITLSETSLYAYGQSEKR